MSKTTKSIKFIDNKNARQAAETPRILKEKERIKKADPLRSAF